MKSNSDSLTKGSCKEEDITCIFTDVPNFLTEETSEENTCWLQGSHRDVLVGKKSIPGSLNESSNTQIKTNTRTLSSDEEMPNKSRRISNSDDSVPEIAKPKRLKASFWDSSEIILPFKLLKKKSISFDLERTYNLEDLCKDCHWIVKLAKEKSSDSSFSEDEEYVNKLREFQLKNKESSDGRLKEEESSKTVDLDQSEKKRVHKLLKEVHVSILESCIILIAGKLYNKAQKTSKSEMSLCEVSSEDLLDQIMADEEITDKKSKLGLALGQMVTKYLNIK